jgi:hypothetical protein
MSTPRAIPACAGSILFDLAIYQWQAAISMTCRETDTTPPTTLGTLIKSRSGFPITTHPHLFGSSGR